MHNHVVGIEILRRVLPAIILLTALFGFAAWVVGQDALPRFKILDVKLPSSEVKVITRSSDGFLWIGTATGLVRYDGFEAVKYSRPVTEAGQSPNDYVDRIVEYPAGKLWIRSGSTFSVFDMERERYIQPKKEYLTSMGIETVPVCVFADSRQRLWLGFYGGYVKCREASGEIKDIQVSEKTDGKSREVKDIGETSEGIIIVYDDGHFVCLDRSSLSERWCARIPDVEQEHTDWMLFADREGLLWLSGYNWQGCYSPKEKRWLETSRGNNILTICQDTRGRIWKGREHGLDIFDKQSGQTVTICHDGTDERSIPYNTVNALFSDVDGTVWIGTRKNGMAYWNPCIYKSDFLSLYDVSAIAAARDGNVWIGTNSSGMVKWNPQSGQQQRFGTTEGLPSNTVVSLLSASDGRLWVGTFLAGLCCYDGHSFLCYAASGEPNSLANPNVWTLTEDAEGNIWIGTLGGGLQMLNPRTGTFTTYDEQNTSLPLNLIASLSCDKAGTLYIATMSSGIYVKRRNESIKPLGSAGRMRHFTYQILPDAKGRLWIATHCGLFVYESGKDNLRSVPLQGVSSHPVVFSLAEDRAGRIWVTTESQVLAIDADGDMLRYDANDGMKMGSTVQPSLCAMPDGRVLVGTLMGLNVLHPESIIRNTAVPHVLFTGLWVLGRKCGVGDEPEGRLVLSRTLNSQRELTLSHSQSAFTVHFASDNMILPGKTRFRYRLEGFDREEYECAPDVHWVTYTSLPSGHYTLHVRAINSDGVEGPEASVSIRILPPWWFSFWAWIVYALMTVAALAAVFYAIHRRERIRFHIRQMEDEAQKTEELNQMKFRFFTNVSHELRTPLTLIISPLDNLYHELADGRQKTQVDIVRKNANRLLMLVNQLLDFRKMEMADMKLQLSEGDIVDFIRNICNTFAALNNSGGVQLTFFSAMPSLHMAFDADKMSKTMFNLLSNAFKFTPRDGRVDVALSRSKENADMLSIRVADTGIGISDNDKKHIFDRFYQVSDTADTRHAAGSGIGLNLVKEFVEMHGGSISVVDNLESGSVFIILLPIRQMEKAPETNIIVAAGQADDDMKVAADETTDDATVIDRTTVLVVDDNDDLVTFMRDTFSLYYHVRTASNGQQAWELIQAEKPDIIVSDMMMPVMDGNELCRRVKGDAATRHIPFVILTARLADESRLESLKIGADEYVTKPFNTEVLLLRLQKLLELSRHHGYIEPQVSDVVVTPMDEKMVEEAIKFVEQHIDNADLSVDDLSRALNMSRSNLYNKMADITGKKPKEFIRVIRMKRAAQLLRDSDLNISEVAYRVGLNPRIFARHFKDEFGCLPSEFQERKRSAKD